jgi:hypothetical protein
MQNCDIQELPEDIYVLDWIVFSHGPLSYNLPKRIWAKSLYAVIDGGVFVKRGNLGRPYDVKPCTGVIVRNAKGELAVLNVYQEWKVSGIPLVEGTRWKAEYGSVKLVWPDELSDEEWQQLKGYQNRKKRPKNVPFANPKKTKKSKLWRVP